MKKITVLSFLTFCIMLTSFAQDVEYNKKKNKFMVGETAIAQLDSKKDNGWGFTRSFFLQDLEGKNMIDFFSESHKDTLFADFHNWYRVEIPAFALNFMIPDAVELNNEKYFAKLVSEFKLLGNDGKLVEEQCRVLAKQNVFDFKAQYEQYNDSLKKFVTVPKIIVERKRNKLIFADEMGRIGQGDAVIGNWDVLMRPSNSFDHKLEKYYIIKNVNGGIVAIIGPGKMIKFEKRREEDMIMPNTELVHPDTEKDVNYMTRVGNYLVSKNLL